MQVLVAASEFKELSRHELFIQNIVKIMHKRMRLNLLRQNRFKDISEVYILYRKLKFGYSLADLSVIYRCI